LCEAGHRPEVGRGPFRQIGPVPFSQPGKLRQRFVVEDHHVEFTFSHLALFQAIRHGEVRDAGIVLLAGEALFLGSGRDAAVLNQAGTAVVV